MTHKKSERDNGEMSARRKAQRAIWNKKYYQTHKDDIIMRQRQYDKAHQSERTIRNRRYNKIRKENGQFNEYYRNKRGGDINFRIANNLRNRIWVSLKRTKSEKQDSFYNLTGCSVEELKNHLEKQFKNGMTWDNYGFYGWQIDHIIPCASFDLSCIEQQKKCFHYTNLQPLWARDNLVKGDSLL